MMQCPVCHSTASRDSVWRDSLPTMQNYVHRTYESSMAAFRGEFRLAVCQSCGFAWNRTFDRKKILYDENYDNAVPSTVMGMYYQEISEYLNEKYNLHGGLIVDIGCGNGEFLRALCDVQPDCRGLGIDPALDHSKEELDGRLALVRSEFSSDLLMEQPTLVVCRHVLEHIPEPVAFLRCINNALTAYGSCHCFFEVPDLSWIVENRAFWDFCYEHCNYFTSGSLSETLRRAGFEPRATRLGFGSQYRWMEARSEQVKALPWGPAGEHGLVDQVLRYADDESVDIAAIRDQIKQAKTEGQEIAIWGMATKGVIFSLLIDPDATLIDFCIDMNPNKQGCFVPIAGHSIEAPEVLLKASKEKLIIIVMNENYGEEIFRKCREMGLDPILVNANGTPI